MPFRVQNFELHLLLKNCLKNKWFIQFFPNGLNIMNLATGTTALKMDLSMTIPFFKYSISF
jgi:hypothetical protein